MKSFAYMRQDEFDNDLCYEILNVMSDLKNYFIKFNRGRADEAMQKTLHHALSHYKADCDLVPYIKKLAQTILLTKSKATPYEFLEEVIKDTDDTEGSVVDDDCELESYTKINELALYFMPYFIFLCSSFSSKSSNTKYFPKEFKSECLRLIRINENFNETCIGLCNKYGGSMQSFLALEGDRIGEWRETDYSFIKSYTSKRVHFVNSLGESLLDSSLNCSQDLDELRWFMRGKFGDKRVIRIKYIDLWDLMCDEISSDSGINRMKFTIGSTFIIRTLAGSLSIVNPNIDNEYELCLDEILTNLLYLTSGRYLGRGTEFLYFLVDSVKDLSLVKTKAMGVDISFIEEDITETALSRLYE